MAICHYYLTNKCRNPFYRQTLTFCEIQITIHNFIKLSFFSLSRIKDNAVVTHCAGLCAYGVKLESVLTEIAQ